jgi:hypothetical protein
MLSLFGRDNRMKIESYIVGLRSTADRLRAQKATVIGCQNSVRDLCGTQCLLDVTNEWLLELDRRIEELRRITETLERNLGLDSSQQV